MQQMNRLPVGPQFRSTTVLLVHLLLILFSTGQSKLIGPSQPIVATVGDDIILPCHLEPAVDVAAMTLEWTTSDLDPRFVFVWHSGQEGVKDKHPSYKGRTSLFTDELKHGNISLKLSKVKPADEGRYRCYVTENYEESVVELVVGAAASPVISLTGIDGDKGAVVLQCESKGWYPEPELLWLDAEGKILSAGPTETVRGPDDLYTVSSRLTVEKRHSNNITCRVQQRNINQTRETQMYFADYFVNIQSRFVAATIGLSVCIVILSLFFFLRKKSRRCQCAKSNDGEMRNVLEMKKPKDQFVIEDEQEREELMTNEIQLIELKTHKSGLQELQMTEEKEKSVNTLKEELEIKKKEVEKKQAELQQLQEENQKIEKNLQTLRKKLENKKKELETITATKHGFFTTSYTKEEHQKKITEAEREVESLKKELETTETKIEEIKNKQAEFQILQEDIKKMEANLQEVMENEDTNDTEILLWTLN
uniref:Ig-like domain-containing protein n=1 Tax=Anabas testudineus TaxID=64144 RepID=A0A7N6BMF8_ANATE